MGRYTHGHEAAALASHATRTAATSATYLLPVLAPGMSLLDVGCGPGTITADLAALVAPGEVTAIENTEPPLIATRTLAAERGLTNLTCQLDDVLDLSFPDDSFDVVHAHQVLQHVTDPVRALREMVRVCKPGGWIAARDADYAAMAWHPEVPALDLWRTTYRAAARANGAEPDAGRRLRAWARAAEVPNPTFTNSSWHYADAASCAWWGNSQADRCAGEVFGTQAREQGLTPGQIGEIVAGWRAWGADVDAWFLIPNTELLGRK